MASEPVLTDAIQDYLKEIYKLRLDTGKATTTTLAKRLRVSPASVSAMVKKLALLGLVEHVLSEELEARIDQALGYPTHDPHGDPIPDAGLKLGAERLLRPLSALDQGEEATVLRIPDDDELLPQLSTLGLVPGTRVAVKKRRPLTVSIDGNDQVVSR